MGCEKRFEIFGGVFCGHSNAKARAQLITLDSAVDARYFFFTPLSHYASYAGENSFPSCHYGRTK
jgi:hypothetical protein